MYLCRLKDFKEPTKWEHVLRTAEHVALGIFLEYVHTFRLDGHLKKSQGVPYRQKSWF